jgi:hypothetical protein
VQLLFGLGLVFQLAVGRMDAELALGWKILPSATVMFVVGLIDDLWGLKPAHKLAGQVIAAGVACWSSILIRDVEEHFGNLSGSAEPCSKSIDARVPYLDHTLVERLWNTPPESKLDKNLNKPQLVRAVDDDAVLQAGMRPKRGFAFPMARWMKIAAPEMQEIAESGSLVQGAVRGCWNDFSRGHTHWSLAWALTVPGATS